MPDDPALEASCFPARRVLAGCQRSSMRSLGDTPGLGDLPAMHPFRHAARAALEDIHRQGRYRTFMPLQKHADRFPVYTLERDEKIFDITVWSSNDYLGMGVHPVVINAAAEAARSMGAGAGGTRNIAGTSHLHDALETELADLHGKQAALLFTSGYVANHAANQRSCAACRIGTSSPMRRTTPP